MFYVGQKVVCVDASNASAPLLQDGVYTIASVILSGLGVTLFEVNHAAFDDWWIGFRSERFRPVVERKTSIEIFKAMLTPKTEQVSA